MEIKRLFLFAGYDPQGVIDGSLLHYLRCLSGYGDIIFVMDNTVSNAELSKLEEIPNILYKAAERHGEYDFGSYKRAYLWAEKKHILKKYDWVYLVNDSVYGPLYDIKNILISLENNGADLTGMIDFVNKFTPVQVQSWFVGLSREVATSDFFATFIKGVCPQTDKQLIVLKYEVGLSQLILRHGYKMATFISGENGEPSHRIYEQPLEMLKRGLPFVKKQALMNLYGMQYLYPYTSETFVDQIYHNALRTGISLVPLAVSQHERPRYEKSYRLTFWSIPILTIYRQRHDSGSLRCYKLYLFDFVPLIKILIKK